MKHLNSSSANLYKKIFSKQRTLRKKNKTFLMQFCDLFSKCILNMVKKTRILAKKDPIVTFSFKNGQCETLDSSFLKLEKVTDILSFAKCYRKSISVDCPLFVKRIILEQRSALEAHFEKSKQKQISTSLRVYHNNERTSIIKDLNGKCFYNMSNKTLGK